MSHWPYSVLGVEPDAELVEIKRAYARKLKQTHPEDDPAGFQALREAYEAASQRGSRSYYRPSEDALEPPEQASFRPEPTPAAVRSPTAVPSTQPEEELSDLRDALLSAIETEGTDETKRAALAAILASPALENVSTHNAVESWVCHLIADYPGAADALIDPAIAAFRWDSLEGRWDTPPQVLWALHRRNALISLRLLRDPRSKMHKGYQLLQRPPKSGLAAFMHGGAVRPVLALIETEPGLYPEFDGDAVEAWTERLDNQPIKLPAFTRANLGHLFRLGLLLLWFGFMLYKCVSPEVPNLEPKPVAAMDCRAAARAERLPPTAWDICAAEQVRSETSLEWRKEMALVNLRRGDASASERGWTNVLDISPTDARALYGLGLARGALQYPDGGLSLINQALAVDPKVGQEFSRYEFAAPSGARPGAAPQAPKQDGVMVPKGATITRPEIVKTAGASPFYYPEMAQRQQVEGRAVIRCKISLDSRPTNCIVVSEMPQDYGFAASALGYVQSLTVRPLLADGKPVEGSSVTVPVAFKLN